MTELCDLPIDLLILIGQKLAPLTRISGWKDISSSTVIEETAVAAASCIMACKTTRHIGFAAYRTLLHTKVNDVSIMPDRTSTCLQLSAALKRWNLPSSGRKAELWARILKEYSPHCPLPQNMRGQIMLWAPTSEFMLRRNFDKTYAVVAKHVDNMKMFKSVKDWKRMHQGRVLTGTFFKGVSWDYVNVVGDCF